FDQGEVLGAPGIEAALEAEDLLETRLAQQGSGTVGDYPVIADGDQDLALLLLQRRVVGRYLADLDVARVHDVALAKILGAAHVDDDCAAVDQPHRIGRSDLRLSLRQLPDFEDYDGDEQRDESRSQVRVVDDVLGQLAHRASASGKRGKYS